MTNVGTVNNCYTVLRQGTRETYELNTRTGLTFSKTVGRLFDVSILKYEGTKYVIDTTRKCRQKQICEYKYLVSQEECAKLREGVPYIKIYRYNPKHLCPKLNGYGDNG